MREQLCKKLDEFGTVKSAKNTVYRKLWNWEGESRWTLLFSIYETLQQAADFVNSVVPADPIQLDSLPARYALDDKYKKQLQEQQSSASQSLQQQLREEKERVAADVDAAAAAERKKIKKRSAATNADAATTTTTAMAQEAILVAKNVDRVLSMRSLHESLLNVKIAITQFTNKKRYMNDEVTVPLFFSLLNSATRIAQRIQDFLTELKAM